MRVRLSFSSVRQRGHDLLDDRVRRQVTVGVVGESVSAELGLLVVGVGGRTGHRVRQIDQRQRPAGRNAAPIRVVGIGQRPENC